MEMILDKQLKNLLVKHGMTIAALSRITKISPKTLYQWSNGQKPKDLNQLKKVVIHFNISMDALVFGEINAGIYEVVLRRVKIK